MATGAFKGQGTKLNRAGLPIAECVNFDLGGAKADFDDATNMDSVGNFKEFIPTLLESGELSFTGNFLGVASTSQAQLVSDFNNFTLSTWTMVFPSGRGTVTFDAYVAQFDLKVPHDKKVDFSSKLKITGPVTIS